jgi:hypothetical protein
MGQFSHGANALNFQPIWSSCMRKCIHYSSLDFSYFYELSTCVATSNMITYFPANV